jgi:lipid-A-disaccharide synthase
VRVMISCGEPSGDLYAGALAREIRALDPSSIITGFGSDKLREAGATLVSDFSGLSVTGLLEVVRLLPKTYATYRQLVAHAREQRPDVFVAIDFPDFNFRLAAAVRALGVPVVYYISPQLWAWRPGRMKTMRRIADKVLVIFPFEEGLYRQAGVPVQWVGHPLLDAPPDHESRDTFLGRYGIDPSKRIVALLPGSRRNELREILPDLLASARLIGQVVPNAEFVLARAPHLPDDVFDPVREAATGIRVTVINGSADRLLASAELALVASGTITVQAALHECPMVVVYRLSPITYRLGRPFVRVDTFAMANLVAGRKVVPELMQDDFTPEAVARESVAILRNPEHAANVRSDLRDVRRMLGPPGASRRAAEAVLAVAAGASASTGLR